MTTVNKDIDTLASESSTVTLESGFEIEIERLKTRQLMSLLKILTRGAGSALQDMNFSEGMSQEAFTSALAGAVIFSIPEAEDETIEFLVRMTKPKGLIDNPKSKPEKEVNETLYARFVEELDNPELEDLVLIVEQIVKNEAPHIQALGKRLAVLLKMKTQSDTAKQGSSSSKS